jgi:hypothetical protein
LFDSGASHSFISRSFANSHNLSPSVLDKIMVIQSPVPCSEPTLYIGD